MDPETISIREKLEIDLQISVLLLDKVDETLFDGLITALGLRIGLQVVSSREVRVRIQYSAESVKKPGNELPSIISERLRPGAVRLHPVVKERVDHTSGGSERDRANQLREVVDDQPHELMSTLRLRK